MIDLSEEEVEYNIQTTKKYLQRAAPMSQWLEMVRIKEQHKLWYGADCPTGDRYHRW